MSQVAMHQLPYPIRGLFWKEARQIFPLIAMLIVVSALLIVLESTTNFKFPFRIAIVIPSLYAAGVGAILVGLEKETRTLLWCTSLPIASSRIATMKYVVALLGLLLMLFFSLLIRELADGLGTAMPSWTRDETKGENLYWFSHSLYLLFCGFFTAWWLKNTFASLIALIPIAAIPYLAIWIFSIFNKERAMLYEEWTSAIAFSNLIGTMFFAVLGYRAALGHLAPAQEERGTGRLATWLSELRPASTAAVVESPFRFSLSSLVWQSIRQNRMALSTLLLFMIIGTLSVVFSYLSMPGHDLQDFANLGMVVGALAVSWLGVTVFSGDGSAARMRFLADRGVSPTIAWWGRQLIGLSFLAFVTLLYAICTYWIFGNALFSSYMDGLPPYSMFTFGLGLLAVYSISQFVSQNIRILAASAILAPILSSVFMVWILVAIETAEAPWWTIAICLTLPMIATWAMMRRYMDNHYRWPVWATALFVAAMIYVLPTIPFAIEVRNWPKISQQDRAELIAEAYRLPRTSTTVQRLSEGTTAQFDHDFYSKDLGSDLRSWMKGFDHSPESIFAIGDTNLDSTTPLQLDAFIFRQGINAADYVRIKLESDPKDAETVELLGQWINAFAVIAKRLRLSDRWIEQEAADAAEIWLTAVLSDPQMKEHLSQDFAKRAIEVIADQETRNKSRRRAVLASWRNHLEAENSRDVQDRYGMGGFVFSQIFKYRSQAKLNATLDISRDALVALAIRFIEIGSSGQDTLAIRRELHNLVWSPEIPFEIGPYANVRRSTGSFENSNCYHDDYGSPATQWFAPWETVAAQLKTTLSTSDN